MRLRYVVILIFVAIAVVYGCMALIYHIRAVQAVEMAPKVSPDEQYAIDTAKQAESDVRDLMKDPDATKFKQLVANGQAQCVSGQFMGKNSYGAYDGYRIFVWDHGKITLQGDSPVAAAGASFACIAAMERFGGNRLTSDPT